LTRPGSACRLVLMNQHLSLAFGLWLVCVWVPGVSAAAPTPEIVAHRGASHDAPENTLAAFRLAWRQGADAIEGDFWLTKDGKIVCIHDETTERVAKRKLAVADSTLAELRQLDVGSWKGPQWAGQRIPTIGEVLAAVPEGKRIFIEIKCGPEILAPLKKALADSGLKPRQTVIIAFDARVIAQTKRQLPGLRAFWLTDFKQDEQTGKWRPTVQQVLATLKQSGADGLDCRAHALVDQQFVEQLRRNHREFHAWTVDDLPTAERFRDLGVDSLTTNRPGWLKRQLPRHTGMQAETGP
jgi:glycerophosphoryl diester phosphodiesterase